MVSKKKLLAKKNTKNNKKVVKKIAIKPVRKPLLSKNKAKTAKKPFKKKILKKITTKKVTVKKKQKPQLKKTPAKNVAAKKKSLLKPFAKVTKSKIVASKAAVPRNKGAASGPLGVLPYNLQKDEEYMIEKQLQHFEKILNFWKQQLMQEVDRTIYDMQGVVNYADQVDRASQEEEFSLKLRERDRERKLLKKIDEALLRIKNGDYGYCDECGAEIGVRRLEARPIATQCIECKTIAELREKQIGG